MSKILTLNPFFLLDGSDALQGDLEGPQRAALPVVCDWTEEAVLDGIPFRSSRWVMTDSNGNPVLFAEFLIKSIFPQSCSGSVASSAVAQNQQLFKIGISFLCKFI